MRIPKVKNQQDREIESHTTYEKWVFSQPDKTGKKNKINEDVRANPDSLQEDQGYYHQTDTSKETSEKIKKLMEYAPRFLTEKQWRVFESMAVNMNTPKDTSKLLGIGVQSVYQHFKAAQKRLQKLYETL